MSVLINGLGNFSPEHIMCDYERGLRNSLQSNFPTAVIDGCYFHFPQALMRRVHSLGLKRVYERVNVDINGIRTYSPLRIWIRRLMGLAFVPTANVVTEFGELVNQIPDTLAIDEFLAYFKSTWIEGTTIGRRIGRARFPPETWNVRTRTLAMMNRTNNVVESFNKRFSEGVGHSNPTIWNFLSAMKLEQSMTDAKQTAVLVGERPPKRLAKYTRKDDRILTSINRYGVLPLLEFLDLMMDL